MKDPRIFDRNSLMDRLITIILSVWLAVSLTPLIGLAQSSAPSKRVLALYWRTKDTPGNISFDKNFQAALQSGSAGAVEYYSEYSDSFRFSGEDQSDFLADYLQRKYADRKIDVIVALADNSLDFLLKYRARLFPNVPIVFAAIQSPAADRLAATPGMTGIILGELPRKTIELAQRLKPDTNRVFVVSGTLQHDKRFETTIKKSLKDFNSNIQIDYLTDLSSDELTAKVKSSPPHSVILYVNQMMTDKDGKVLDVETVQNLILKSAAIPVYGMSEANIYGGVIGGYVHTDVSNAARTAEMALRVANGERAQDIPVESVPSVVMVDWRALRRWGIDEDLLPQGAVIRFKPYGLWDQYKKYVIGAMMLITAQMGLIGWLLLERRRRRRAEEARRHLAAIVESSDDAIIGVSLDGTILSWNPGAESLYGYHAAEMEGRHISILAPPDRREELSENLANIKRGAHIKDFETIRIGRDGSHIDVSIGVSPIKDDKGRVIAAATITRDISERKQSEEELQRLTGQLLNLQDDERRRLARELHDVTAQNIFAINMNISRLQRGRLGPAEVKEVLTESQNLGDQSLREIRTLSYLLHPPMLDQAGLPDALKWYIDGFAKRSGISVQLFCAGDLGRLPSEIETTLFRVVQESLTNISRHSGSASATIKLTRDNAEVCLQIKDQGRGIRSEVFASGSESDENMGVGIPGMRQRLRQLGGSLQIESNERGVTVTAFAPITDKDRS